LVDVSVSVAPILDVSGAMIGVLKIDRDESERKRAAEHLDQLRSELFHVSRLTTMGLMASTLAHELNQPLTAVMTYVAALRRLVMNGLTNPELFHEIAGKTINEAARAGGIIQRLRHFISRGVTNRQLSNVNEVVQEAIDLGLVGVAQQGVDTIIRLIPNPGNVLIDRIQIQQVVINLVRNAVEAMHDSDRRELEVETARDGDMMAIRVRDTGSGVASDIADRLFEPFATTKSTGMGVGLSISREIVEAHGGRLWVEPNRPTGAVFIIALPIIGSSA
jgi:two-component system sensor kinase FixL